MISFQKMSKKNQKAELKKHRKPPIPKPRVSDSKADKKRKERRLEKQKLKNLY